MRIHLLKDGDLISAKVVRIPLKTLSSGLSDQAQWEEERALKGGELTLLNVLYAKANSYLAELATYLLRVEDMSHIQQIILHLFPLSLMYFYISWSGPRQMSTMSMTHAVLT